MKIHTKELAPKMLREFHAVLRGILKSRSIFIAAVDGVCLGGGLELALACDFVFATPASTFALPEIDVGCFPPFAAAQLPRLSPVAAADLILTGRRIGPKTAARFGLVHHVRKDAEDAALELAHAFESKSGHALSAGKRALRLGLRSPSLPKALARVERLYARRVVPSADAAEGVAAFMQKRPAAWTHR